MMPRALRPSLPDRARRLAQACRALAFTAAAGLLLTLADPAAARSTEDGVYPDTPGFHVLPDTAMDLVGICLVTNRLELSEYEILDKQVPAIAYQVNSAFDRFANAASPADQAMILQGAHVADKIYHDRLRQDGRQSMMEYADTQWSLCGKAVAED